ncbi:hypothetical protein BC936DRAFT_142446 [Jimgerdemannia flammicorona]|uniref:Integrator complex subunit 4/Protein SIEL C-terminal Ig-like domain-containing protein n=1 Tax=Jimgerdemannia flammicorona TaxID=994334 RepID=A0A433A0C5_9FUNG|nr:hypothetical protein BC936DRAFT_142446 [Jimgerdemannia flammicorona]
MLPKYAFRHHTYLSSRFPDCFPDLDAIRRHSGLTSDGSAELNQPIGGELVIFLSPTAPDNIDIDKFMAQTLELVGSVNGQLERGDYTVAMRTVKVATRYVSSDFALFYGYRHLDLKYAGHVKPLLSGKAEYAALYLECYQTNSPQANLHTRGARVGRSSSTTLLHYGKYFLGLSRADTPQHHVLSVVGKSSVVVWGVETGGWLGRYKGAHTEHVARVHKTRDRSSKVHGLSECRFTSMRILQESDIQILTYAYLYFILLLRRFESDDFRFERLGDLRINLFKAFNAPTANNISALFSFMMRFVPLEIDLRNPFKRTTAAISIPVSNPDKPYAFNAMFPLRIDVEAELSNVADISSIAMEIVFHLVEIISSFCQVTYPDQTVRTFWPPHSHFLPTRPYCFRLSTHVEAFQSAWTDQSHVEIQLVRTFEADLPAHDNYILRYPNVRATVGQDGPTTSLGVGESVRYFLKPEKR